MKPGLWLFFISSILFCIPNSHADTKRLTTPPPVRISPELAQPWLLQLQPSARSRVVRPRTSKHHLKQMKPLRSRQTLRVPPPEVRKKARYKKVRRKSGTGIAQKFLPQTVNYKSRHKAGTILIDTRKRFLYLVLKNGKAKRYGVGVGKPGFEWAGTHKVTRKSKWPEWRPPASMLKRRPDLPKYMAGGPKNPLGARALYLGSTLYRIHGTNQPWTIGKAVSSGCIRMRNQDVQDLYNRVPVGTSVHVM